MNKISILTAAMLISGAALAANKSTLPTYTVHGDGSVTIEAPPATSWEPSGIVSGKIDRWPTPTWGPTITYPNEIFAVTAPTSVKIIAINLAGDVTFAPGVDPDEAAGAALMAAGGPSPNFCEGLEKSGTVTGTTWIFNGINNNTNPPTEIRVDLNPSGTATFTGFTPTPDARRFFEKLAYLERCP